MRAIAPREPLTPRAVTKVVIRAGERAGLGQVAAHRLRHTVATDMLRAGASLPEIGHVLRHQQVSTTAIYLSGRSRTAARAGAAVARGCGMTALERALSDYLTLRWRLGYKLGRPGQLLGQFVAYLDDVDAKTVTIERALEWATQPAGADPNWWAYRLDAVRGFAAYLHTLDPTVPELPRDLLPYRSRRATPYLYSDELAALIAAAGDLPHPLRADTYQTMIALLAVTGLRIGEPIGLDVDDLDRERGVLVVREGKFSKTRQLPLHASTVAAPADYLQRRQRQCPRPRSPALFLSGRGSRVCHCNISATFHELTRVAGLAPRSARCRPRFARRAPHLRRAHGARLVSRRRRRAGADAAALDVPRAGSPELLALAGQRLEQHLEDRS